jgi:antitoxin (DNA-binding transcriptional repressor) of toxin-antitoxin stability system
MKTVEVARATVTLGESAEALAGEPVVVTRDGVPFAPLMPIEEADLDSVALGRQAKFWTVIEQARAQHRAGTSLSAEAVRRELGLVDDPTEG